MGGLGLLQPSSTYHKFAIGMTGDKMSSSKPNTTIFLTDDVKTIEKKINLLFQEVRTLLKNTDYMEEIQI